MIESKLDAELLKDVVKGRELADDIYKYVISEITDNNYNQNIADSLLCSLRNKLIELKPLSKNEGKEQDTHRRKSWLCKTPSYREPYKEPREWHYHEIPRKFTLVKFNSECIHTTNDAALIGNIWIPFSCMFMRLVAGDKIKEWPIATSFCDKNGW